MMCCCNGRTLQTRSRLLSKAASLIPVEVKANNAATLSLCNLTRSDKDHYRDIQYGIKLCAKNIGFNGQFYTFPYFLAFLLKRYLRIRGK